MRSSNRSNVWPIAGGADPGPLDQGADQAPADRPTLAEVRIDAKSFADPVTGVSRLVLDRIRFDLAAGEILAILGPSGCGKTTLLQLVAGLDHDFSGEIRWTGTPDGRRPRLGQVFQDPRLLPWLTLRRNLELVLDAPARQRERIDALLAATGLAEFGQTRANRLSVGMQRRAALARAFVVQPQLLLMDEPFVSLDAPTAGQLRRLLLEVWARIRPTVVLVTHELREAVLLADRILFLCADPARPIAMVEVGIPRAERADERRIGDRHAEIRARFEGLYARRDN